MANFTQRRTRYKMVSDSPRRYRDLHTGELLTQTQYSKRIAAETQSSASANATRATVNRNIPAFNAQNRVTVNDTQATVNATRATSETFQDNRNVTAGDYATDAPTPIADIPEPPPIISMANVAAQAGVDVTQAAAQKTSDSLANLIGETVAMIGNLILDVRVSAERRYLVVEQAAIERVTKPAARLAMRHLPFEWNKEIVSPDAQDAAELAKGIAYCAAAVWANKTVFDAEMRRREEEYAALFDQHYGPGSYARARAQAGGQAAGTGGPVPGPTGPGSQGVVSNGNPYAGAAGANANGSGNHRGDGGRTAGLIYQLYQQYPGAPGQPPDFRRAV